MKLTYYKGENFGDAINPLIFNNLLPGFFNEDDEVIFLGVGSIMGLEKGSERTKKIVVFSSGYGAGAEDIYGEKPVFDAKYDIRCVRGPLTAEYFNLDPSKAIIDGAVLITNVIPKDEGIPKKYKYSFIPHHVSENMYQNWPDLIASAGIHYISPAEPVEDVIEQIQQSECLITEAMHGAILADVYRVPWVAVKMYDHINEFKWRDWLSSLNMDYRPVKLSSMFSNDHIKSLLDRNLPFIKSGRFTIAVYNSFQTFIVRKKLVRKIKSIKMGDFCLSEEKLLKHKSDQLFEQLQLFISNYSKDYDFKPILKKSKKHN